MATWRLLCICHTAILANVFWKAENFWRSLKNEDLQGGHLSQVQEAIVLYGSEKEAKLVLSVKVKYHYVFRRLYCHVLTEPEYALVIQCDHLWAPVNQWAAEAEDSNAPPTQQDCGESDC